MKGLLIGGFDRLCAAVMRHAPPRLAHRFAGWVGRALAPRLYPRVRALASANLARLAPGTDAGAAMAELWDNMARSFLEVPCFVRLYDSGRVEVAGAALLAPRPLIVVGLHLGNWEMVGIAMVRAGAPPVAFWSPPSTAYRTRTVVAERLRHGGRLLPLEHGSGRAALRALQRDRDVLLAFCDELKDGVVSAPSFGRPPRTGGNIAHVARLARLTGAPVVFGWCERLAPGADGLPRFRVTFEAAPEPAGTGDRERDLAARVAALDARMEEIIRPRLPQWLMLHEWSDRG